MQKVPRVKGPGKRKGKSQEKTCSIKRVNSNLSLSRVFVYRKLRVSLGVRTCELFLCFVAIVRVRAIVLTSLFSVFYVTGEFHRFLHRGGAQITRLRMLGGHLTRDVYFQRYLAY